MVELCHFLAFHLVGALLPDGKLGRYDKEVGG